jgi:putative hydrolase of the HAD superfamily
MTRVVLFDLDETLVVEEPAAAGAFEATALLAAGHHDLDVAALALGARSHARELWRATPVHPYCMHIGISSWEGLWCRFEGEAEQVKWLRAWSPTYRREAWRLALAEQGVNDVVLATELGKRFELERRAGQKPFDDAETTLREMSGEYTLAVITNGPACLQREKLAVSGLAHYFTAVFVSGEFGTGKPDAAFFTHALSVLGSDAADTVMVGDSFRRDVDGALATGLDAVWLNRSGAPRPAERPDAGEIATLRDLPHVLTARPAAARTS